MFNKYEEQYQTIEAVIQLLEDDYIAEVCYRETQLDCVSCKAILIKTLLKEIQQTYFELVEEDV